MQNQLHRFDRFSKVVGEDNKASYTPKTTKIKINDCLAARQLT